MKKKKIKFRSEFEKKIYGALRRAKVSFEYEREKISYILVRHYVPDFVIKTPLGEVYVEAKGYLRREDKAKMVAVKKLHPSLDIRMLFYRLNKADIKWAEKNKFPWAIGKIPTSWLTGSLV